MTHAKWLVCVFVVICIMSVGTACRKRGPGTNSTGTILPVPQTTTEAGWPLYEVPAEGFALSLPPDWRQIDMDPKTFEAKFSELARQNPEFEGMRENMRTQIKAGIKFYGLDSTTQRTGFATNVNVLRLPL